MGKKKTKQTNKQKKNKNICSSVCFQLFFVYIYKHNSEKAMVPHSSTLAWRIPWTEEPVRLQSMGSLRVRHN